MSTRKWGVWFVLSILWLYMLLLIAFLDGKIVDTFLYTFGFVIAFLNILACTYIGMQKAEKD